MMTKELLQQALNKAFQLGQTYWQQADSDSSRQHAKADNTMALFKSLIADTLSAIAQPEQITFKKVTCQTCEALARTVMLDQTSHDQLKRFTQAQMNKYGQECYEEGVNHNPQTAAKVEPTEQPESKA